MEFIDDFLWYVIVQFCVFCMCDFEIFLQVGECQGCDVVV